MTHYSTTYFSANQGRSLKRNQNAVRYQPAKKGAFGPISNALLIAILLCVLGLIYLTQITKTSSYGFEINELETKRDQLVQDNRALEVEAARLQALSRVRDSEVAKSLESAPEPNFVNQ